MMECAREVRVAHVQDQAFRALRQSRGDNLRGGELGALKALADRLLGLDWPGLEAMLANGTISEVNCDAQTIRE